MASTLELKKNDQNEKYKRSKYKKRNKKKILLKQKSVKLNEKF